MDNKQVLKAYMSHMDEFYTDMLSVYPNDRIILRGKLFFEALRKTNPRRLITAWKNQIYPRFGDIFPTLNLDNIELLLNHDFSDDAKYADANGCSANDGEEFINKIKEIIVRVKDDNPDNLEKAIKYLDNLTKLSKLYN